MVWKLGKSVHEKLMTKSRCKKGWSSSAHWQQFHQKLVSCLYIGLFQKKDGSWAHTFLKKQLGFLGLLFHPWKFWTKQSYSSIKNPAKLYDTYWEWSQILCDFSFIAPGNFSYFLFNPRKFHIVFLQYSGKIQVLE